MKIDLDELERRATAAIAAEAARPAGLITQEDADASWAHARATEPPVTLALIARIRELKAMLIGVSKDWYRGPSISFSEVARLVEKDVVIP